MRPAFMLFAILFVFATARAQTYTVNQPGDAGDGTCDATCTLRDAINTANHLPSVSTINFAPGLTQITLTSEIVISGILTINGSGANVLTIDGGVGANRIFTITGGLVDINDVTLTGGNGTSATADGMGGAIYSVGNLGLNRVHITGNSAVNGGGVFFGDGGQPFTVFHAWRTCSCEGMAACDLSGLETKATSNSG